VTLVAPLFCESERPTSSKRLPPPPMVCDQLLVVSALLVVQIEAASNVTANGFGVAVAVAVLVGVLVMVAVLVGVGVPIGAAFRTAATSVQPRVALNVHDIVTDPVVVVFTLLAPLGYPLVPELLTTFQSGVCGDVGLAVMLVEPQPSASTTASFAPTDVTPAVADVLLPLFVAVVPIGDPASTPVHVLASQR
jgi:hypothetical protein